MSNPVKSPQKEYLDSSEDGSENGGRAPISLNLKEMALIRLLRKVRFGEITIQKVNFNYGKVKVIDSYALRDEDGLALLKEAENDFWAKQDNLNN